jgi:hypothetical protein
LCRDTVSFRFPLTRLACSRPLNGAQIDDFCELLHKRISFDGPTATKFSPFNFVFTDVVNHQRIALGTRGKDCAKRIN